MLARCCALSGARPWTRAIQRTLATSSSTSTSTYQLATGARSAQAGVQRRRSLHCSTRLSHSSSAASEAGSRASAGTGVPVSPTPSSGSSVPLRTVLFASSDFSLPTLRALAAAASAPSASSSPLISAPLIVVTPTDKVRGRGKKVTPSAFKTEALALGCRVIDLPADTGFKMTEWKLPEDLRQGVDLGVVVSFGYMLPARVIALFSAGVINVHPSLLPRYRGAAPIQFALAHGDAVTGVSIIDVHPERIDGGDILSQESTALPEDATFASMAPQLAEQGARQLMGVLSDLPRARSQSITQADHKAAAPALAAQASPHTVNVITGNHDMSVATPNASVTASPAPIPLSPSPAPRIPKSAGQLLFGLHTPERLYRVWSACNGFMPVWSMFHGERIAIQQVLPPTMAARRLQEARAQAAERAAKGDHVEPDVSHFPTIEEAHNVGGGTGGGLFYEPALQAVGVVCRGSTLASPLVLYVTQLHLSVKAAPVSALTFARGYLDKRRVAAKVQAGWRFVSSEEGPTGQGKQLHEIDWWGPKLDATHTQAKQ